MHEIIRLSLKDLIKHWGLALVLATLFGVTFAAFLTLLTYQASASAAYATLSKDWFVVANSDGLGEIHGSRLSSPILEMLKEKGYSSPIPEIHQIVGTSLINGILLRGMDLTVYQEVSPFTMLEGARLQADDPSRLVMVGETLARNKEVSPGDDLLLRGRKFKVVGIFQTGSIQDNEAWISLADAQTLLNYGKDVSLYLIPADGTLQPGNLLTDSVSVSQKGEGAEVVGRSILAFFNFVGLVGWLAGIATLITLGNLLWRMAWLRRHEFGILKSLGFGFPSLVVYFLSQTVTILLTGILMGLSLAFLLIFARLDSFSAFGLGLSQSWDIKSLMGITTLLLVMLTAGTLVPLITVYKTTTTDLLGRN